MVRDNLSFYPVIQLLTGPPGLVRNGGVWKVIKRDFSNIMDPANIMVQALHMKNYALSKSAWDSWNKVENEETVLISEIIKTFGRNRSLFVDSGGFQLMYQDKIDLSRWGLELSQESIFELQCRFSPDKVASLDYPLSPKNTHAEVQECTKRSIDNIRYLLDNYESYNKIPRPYLVVHGRTSEEISKYLKKIEEVVQGRAVDEIGIALGSQVPFATSPQTIVKNASTVLEWMDMKLSDDIPFHVFGIGEPVAAAVDKINQMERPISFDNSTSVQRGYMQKIYNPEIKKFSNFDIQNMVDCDCAACRSLEKMGLEQIVEVLSSKSYKKNETKKVTRSDIFALITLHNIGQWEHRADNMTLSKKENKVPICEKENVERTYEFSLRSFKNNSPNLIFMACSKTRPYRESQSHKRIINSLKHEGYIENKDYDRITLSGLYGPVSWKDEDKDGILNYDFQLCDTVGDMHKQNLRIRTATVLNTIKKRYDRMVAYLPAKQYRDTFQPILEEFDTLVVTTQDDLCNALKS